MSESSSSRDGLPPEPSHTVPDHPFRSPAAGAVPLNSVAAPTLAAAEPIWGFWATVGFSVPIIGVFLGLQTVVAVGYVMALIVGNGGAVDPAALAASHASDGLLFSLAIIISAPPTVGLIVLIAKLKRGATVRGYLGFQRVSSRVAASWAGVTLVFCIASDVLTYALGRPIVPEFMVNAYTTAGFVPLFWIAGVVMAPIWEEVFFRGFLLEGIRRSALGPIGAVLITSLVWAIIHLQYDAYGIGTIFVGGLLFGTVKLRTGSTSLTIALHALWGAIATVETVIYLHMNGGGPAP
jgi:uncharacterized protein